MQIYPLHDCDKTLHKHRFTYWEHILKLNEFTWLRQILQWDPTEYDSSIRRRPARPYLKWTDIYQHECEHHFGTGKEWFNLTLEELNSIITMAESNI